MPTTCKDLQGTARPAGAGGRLQPCKVASFGTLRAARPQQGSPPPSSHPNFPQLAGPFLLSATGLRLAQARLVLSPGTFAAKVLLHPREADLFMQQLLLLAVFTLGHHPMQPLEVLAAVSAAELVDLVLRGGGGACSAN